MRLSELAETDDAGFDGRRPKIDEAKNRMDNLN